MDGGVGDDGDGGDELERTAALATVATAVVRSSGRRRRAGVDGSVGNDGDGGAGGQEWRGSRRWLLSGRDGAPGDSAAAAETCNLT